MKKLFLIFLLLVGIATASFSQEKSGSSRKRKVFKKSHFDKQKKDPNIKHNGTSVKRNQKHKYKVDGDGFVESKQKRRKRGKKSGLQ